LCQNRDYSEEEEMTGKALHVSLVAIPDAVISTISGIFDVMNSFTMLVDFDDAIPADPPFTVEIVGETGGPVPLVSGIKIETHTSIKELTETDIVIVPSLLLSGGEWHEGRYDSLVDWLNQMHDKGAIICSACSGLFLLAETGLFDGKPATVHWNYATQFEQVFPEIDLNPEQVLAIAGEKDNLVTSGAATSWHDLVLYLIGRFVGPVSAQSVARFFALQWHRDGLAPYITFEAPRDHGDATILAAQDWVADNYSVGSPVEELVKRSGLAERSFKRRFTDITGHSPLAYVQRLRVEEAKRRLERTSLPIDEIGWQVGYEDPAFFRRLFKRQTGVSPGAYRKQFQAPLYSGEP